VVFEASDWWGLGGALVGPWWGLGGALVGPWWGLGGALALGSRLQVFGFIGINIVVINVINVGLVLGIFRFGLIHLAVVLLYYSLLRCQMPNPRNFLLIFF